MFKNHMMRGKLVDSYCIDTADAAAAHVVVAFVDVLQPMLLLLLPPTTYSAATYNL